MVKNAELSKNRLYKLLLKGCEPKTFIEALEKETGLSLAFEGFNREALSFPSEQNDPQEKSADYYLSASPSDAIPVVMNGCTYGVLRLMGSDETGEAGTVYPGTWLELKAMELDVLHCGAQILAEMFLRDRAVEAPTQERDLLYTLINDKATEPRYRELYRRMNQAHDEFILVAAEPVTEDALSASALHMLHERVDSLGAWHIALIYDERLIILADSAAISKEAGITGLTEVLDGQYRAGVSQRFVSLKRCFRAYKQACTALIFGDTQEASPDVCVFSDYLYESLFSSVADELELERFIHPGITRLLALDDRLGTDLQTTLRIYVENRLSAKRTCEVLGLHRSTLQARLDRIAETTGFSYAAPGLAFEVLFSFRMKAFLENNAEYKAAGP